MRPRGGIEALPAALAADRDAAFPLLVRALIDGVYSGALRLLGNSADAEEVTQEAFLRAYRALGRYPAARVGELRLREWVWTIAANLCRNRARDRRRRGEETLDPEAALPDPAPGPEARALASAGSGALAAHLARLPWPQRAAVVLRHVTGLPHAEIAAALGRPVGTVKSDVHRGLQQLRRQLEEEEG
ncbi:MAG: RNA polymerase sigma factor [Actinobacteria bacterium]|nr:RNA polymerase sigma factor [Actinomycetota bacterium]